MGHCAADKIAAIPRACRADSRSSEVSVAGDDARAAFAPLLEQMLPLYPRMLAAGSPPVRDGYQQTAYLAHGWYLRCHRGIESILIRMRLATSKKPPRYVGRSLSTRWRCAG